eukprot:827737-Amphidinium_carterae.1
MLPEAEASQFSAPIALHRKDHLDTTMTEEERKRDKPVEYTNWTKQQHRAKSLLEVSKFDGLPAIKGQNAHKLFGPPSLDPSPPNSNFLTSN